MEPLTQWYALLLLLLILQAAHFRPNHSSKLQLASRLPPAAPAGSDGAPKQTVPLQLQLAMLKSRKLPARLRPQQRSHQLLLQHLTVQNLSAGLGGGHGGWQTRLVECWHVRHRCY
jgi:hypothetical protein